MEARVVALISTRRPCLSMASYPSLDGGINVRLSRSAAATSPKLPTRWPSGLNGLPVNSVSRWHDRKIFLIAACHRPCHISCRNGSARGAAATTRGRRNPLNTRNARSRKPAESGQIGLGDRRSGVQISAARQQEPQVRANSPLLVLTTADVENLRNQLHIRESQI